jgi:hypothetical protein
MAVGGSAGQCPAVFGDFWRQAARLASPPPYPDAPTGAEQIRHITLAVGRAATMMNRYAGDIGDRGAVGQMGLWAAATARARIATTLVAGASRREAASAPMFSLGSFAARLDGYAAALTYGRDLLHTHLAVTADGERRALSDWAPVISSEAVNRALLAGLADHARAIAAQLAGMRLAEAADPDTVAAWQRLQGTAAQLRGLGAAVQAAQWQAPVPLEHRRLLEAILVNVTPVLQAPSAEASVSELCVGIIGAAQRGNRARRELAARAAWSPELTADSMRHAAANYVVVSFNTETVYRVLAERARQLGYHALTPALDAAADRADHSRRGWLAVAHVWDAMVTDSRGCLSRPAAEAGQLALWTGRLAYADPAWTPARRPSHAVRDPASLAPEPAGMAEVASALHYATDSLARAARTDLDTVRKAAAAGRLYVTTRSLPEGKYDVPRPYADAPRDRVADALAVYADSVGSSQAALRSAADVAAAVDAPSRMLSAAEQAVTDPAAAPRGRLEQNLLDLGVRDAQMLRQGAELDQMTQRVLAQAHRSGLVRPQPDTEVAPEPDAHTHLVGKQLDADTAEIHAPVNAADGAIGRAAERDATRAAAIDVVSVNEPVIHEFRAEPSFEPSWPQTEAEGPSTTAALDADASLDAPEIGDKEPELEL